MHSTSLAVAIVDDWTALGKDVKTMINVVVLGIIYFASVGTTWGATRSMLKAGVAAVGGAVVLGVVASQMAISNKTAEELQKDHTVGRNVRNVRVVDLPEPGAPAFLMPSRYDRSGRSA